jgi:hypothetical protein
MSVHAHRPRGIPGYQAAAADSLLRGARTLDEAYDFADLVQRLRDAGLTGKASDGTIQLRAPKDP